MPSSSSVSASLSLKTADDANEDMDALDPEIGPRSEIAETRACSVGFGVGTESGNVLSPNLSSSFVGAIEISCNASSI
jgi:hypothetical protein